MDNVARNADFWIRHLDLQAHPEGGFYKETYRSSSKTSLVTPSGEVNRNFSTAIYFLLRSQDRSLFHRIKSDEMWHYYAGSSLTIFVLQQDELKKYKLGNAPEKNESLQIVIPAGAWFGALVNEPESFVLSGCTVSPGFDFADFEMAERKNLLNEFPVHREIIERLTK